jgi:hypothetical protein
MLQSPDGKNRRARILSDIEASLKDPRAPKVEHAAAMTDLVSGLRTMQSELRRYDNDNSRFGRIQKENIKNSYYAWAQGEVKAQPQVRAFFERAILPDLGVDEQ